MIREFEERDAEGAAALIAEHSPWFATAEGTLHRLRSVPPRARRRVWVAEEADRVVGWAEAEFDWTSSVERVGAIWAIVHPSSRGRRIGSELYALAKAHLLTHDARELRSWSEEDGAWFLERRGYVRAREERISAVDPRAVVTRGLDALGRGIELRTVAELEDRLAEVHTVYAEAAADMPADHAAADLPFDEWLEEKIGDPDLELGASFVVLVDDRPASLSFVKIDRARRRGEHDLTGTARAFRRRGLARVAKLAVMRECARRGIVRVTTGNDATNAGMLAINGELGFVPYAVETEWVKPLE